MKKEVLLSAIMTVMAIAAMADEYTDPQTNVVYTYEPGQTTASVKAGYEDGWYWYYDWGTGGGFYSGSPDAAGDVVILDRFTIGTTEYVVKSIGYAAFRLNKNVKSISIPETVTDIGECAFQGCNNLTSVLLPDGLTQIANSLFDGCDQLVSVNIPSSVYTIGNFAFDHCFSLTNLTLPACITSVGRYAFRDTPWYTSLYKEAPDGPFYIGSMLLGYKGDKPAGDLVIKDGTTCICDEAFFRCEGLTKITIPEGVTSIGIGTFFHCHSLTSIVIPSSVSSIGRQAFFACWPLTSVVSMIEEPFEIVDDVFELYDEETHKRYFPSATLYVPKGCKARYESTGGWKNFKEIVELPAQDDYRPFVEEGKVWKVGNTQTILDNSVQVVDYYYFAGDTIIDGKICKQMMCQRFVNPNHPYYEYFPKSPSKVGAWYEENKKIYFYDETRQSTRIMYDFSLNANDTLLFLTDWSSPFIIGPKQTGGIDGFKGVYRDIRMCGEEGQSYHDTFWLEGVGCIRGPISNPCDPILGDPKPEFLMSCTVGDEIIYLNDEVEDGASPEGTGARKKRFDFTHTIKIQPKARKRSEELSLYGEYNDLQLGINLAPLDDAYQVRITDESGKAVYEKSVNAGSIVGLNIDISAYAEGRYTVTVENSQESFTGEFDTQTTGISDATRLNDKEKVTNDKRIYNLQGQRLSSLQKGLNIVNGQKIYVK